MQAIRQTIATQKLRELIDIPEDFSSDTVEIIVLPISSPEIQFVTFNPEVFFSASRLAHVDQLLSTQRDEWER